jgi:hypothetical protein
MFFQRGHVNARPRIPALMLDVFGHPRAVGAEVDSISGALKNFVKRKKTTAYRLADQFHALLRL